MCSDVAEHDCSGTLQNGESRLLFSSAQVDYVRYWLHATGLTKNWLPLPYSDCLLTESNLRNVTPVVFETGIALRKAIKVCSINQLNPTLFVTLCLALATRKE
jgi:hypothetical protein